MKSIIVFLAVIVPLGYLLVSVAPQSWSALSSSRRAATSSALDVSSVQHRHEGVVKPKMETVPLVIENKRTLVPTGRRGTLLSTSPSSKEEESIKSSSPSSSSWNSRQRDGIVEVLYNGKWKAVAPLDERGYFKVPKGVDRVVMEVGTNANPDYLPLLQKRPEVLYIMVEPVVVDKATEKCRTLKDRCIMWPAAAFVRESTTVMNVGFMTQCSSLLSAGQGCAKVVDQRRVPLFTLDTMLSFVPPHLHFELLALDCQGTDLLAAAGLRKYRDRVAYLMLECQDLPLWHSEFISPGGYSCGQAISCLRENWQDWSWKECIPNIGPREYNCIVVNTKHALTSYVPLPKPTFAFRNWPAIITFEETCPALFATGEGAPGNEDPPRTMARAPLACDKEESRQVLEARFPKLPCDAKMWRNISKELEWSVATKNRKKRSRDQAFYKIDLLCNKTMAILKEVLGVASLQDAKEKINTKYLPPFAVNVVRGCFNLIFYDKPLLRPLK